MLGRSITARTSGLQSAFVRMESGILTLTNLGQKTLGNGFMGAMDVALNHIQKPKPNQ